tara:strand:- start:10714 stop:11553 length:840 start_codon:yes stop_codon:yes gene_type:complete
MIWFYFPFFYLIHSRLKKKFELVSWQVIFFIPQLLITYYYLDVRSNIFVHLFLIAQVIFYSLYETGYIQNDVITTQNEKNPTNRLNKKNKNFVLKNYTKITNLRYLITIFFIFVLLWLDSFTAYRLNFTNFLLILIITKIIFYIHNNIRNRLTIITFFLLSFFKYSFPIFLFISEDKLFYPLLLCLIIFPVLRAMEVITLERYNFKTIKVFFGNIDKLRVIYYSVLLFVLIMSKIFNLLDNFNFYLLITVILYFLLFRICCFYIIKYGIFKRNPKINKD